MKIRHKIIIGDSRWMKEVLDQSVHLAQKGCHRVLPEDVLRALRV